MISVATSKGREGASVVDGCRGYIVSMLMVRLKLVQRLNGGSLRISYGFLYILYGYSRAKPSQAMPSFVSIIKVE